MPKGQCNPSPDPFNQQTLESDGVLLDIQYGWDGTSVFPDCDGPISRLHVSNTSVANRYVQVVRKRDGKAFTITLTPGTNQTITNTQQLANFGLSSLSDLQELRFTRTPTPPGAQPARTGVLTLDDLAG